MAILYKPLRRLSQLQIDTDKDWRIKGISNLGKLDPGMVMGSLMQFDGTKIVDIFPTIHVGHVLTSQGPGKLCVWAPGGTYLNRFIPVSIDLTHIVSENWTPDNDEPINSPITLPWSGIHGGAVENGHADWWKELEPAIVINNSQTKNFAPDNSENKNPTADTSFEAVLPVNGAVADDGGVQTDETAEAKSGLTVDQSYTTGDDSQENISPTYWEAQTFTTGLEQRVRGVWIKVYRSTSQYPGTITVGIRAVDGSGHPTGADLCLGTYNGNSISHFISGDTANWIYIPFTTGVILATGTKYAIVVRAGAEGIYWRNDSSSPGYASGNREYSTNAGANWTTNTSRDFMFQVGYTLDDMTLLPAALAVGDAYYWGYDSKFNRIYQDISVPGEGTYILVWEYSKGGGVWASCVDLDDGTNSFQNFGEGVIDHTPQGDWAVDTVGGIANKYWIRARVTDAGVDYVQPLGSYAKQGIDY